MSVTAGYTIPLPLAGAPGRLGFLVPRSVTVIRVLNDSWRNPPS
jgi:hypothetical protein